MNPRTKPPGQKPPLPKKPQTKHSFLSRNFITFVFRMSYGKEISIWFLALKYTRHWVYIVVHGWHNLMVGWRFLKELFCCGISSVSLARFFISCLTFDDSTTTLLATCDCVITDLFDDLVVENMEFCFACKLVTTFITFPANCSTA